jgi:hypothetical protein
LCFGDDLYQNFFERQAAGVFYYSACDGRHFRRGHGVLGAGEQAGAYKKEDDREAAGY